MVTARRAGGRWAGDVIVLTGAGSGTGRSLAPLLAAEGAHLVLVGRRRSRLEESAKDVVAAGGPPPLVAPCDVTDVRAVAELAQTTMSEAGRARILVNNAGRGAHGPFVDVALVDHHAVIATNLTGTVNMTHAFLPQMLARGGGHLVFVSSVLGELPAPDHAVYGATKFAVSGFGESLRHELRGRGVAVTVVEPGLVRSEFADVSGTPLARFHQVPSKSPEQAALDVLRVMRAARAHAVCDRLSRAAIRLRRHAPRLFSVIFGAAYRRARRQG